MNTIEYIKQTATTLWNSLSSCTLCPHRCRVNRLKGEMGICSADSTLRIAAFHAHFGEENGLVGQHGSGTVFFSHCNLRCIYCQNYDISHLGHGHDYSIEDLAEIMIHLQDNGCHNINVVTPTHYLPHLLFGLALAKENGLTIPLVYNTSGYELPAIITLLDGIVDIYLTDVKYFSSQLAERLSPHAGDYPKMWMQSLPIMAEQTGLKLQTSGGVFTKGLMIRHLVLPGCTEDSKQILLRIAQHLSPEVYINLMSQYHPCYLAGKDPILNRHLTREEYMSVVSYARELGFTNLEVQGFPF